MKTTEEKLAFLLSNTARRTEQAERFATRSDIDAGDQFLSGVLHMIGADGIEGTDDEIAAARATFACMVHDLRAAERLRIRRST